MRLFCLLLAVGTVWGAEWKLAPAAENKVDLYVEKTGALGGKKHWFRFPQFSGTYSEEPGRVELKIVAKELQCFDTWLNAKDQKTVLSYTLGKEVLDVAKFPTIAFVSTGVEGEKVSGRLTIRGIEKPAVVMVKRVGENQFTGSAVIKMSEFGIKPPKAGLGLIGTKDEMRLEFQLRGTP